MTKVGKEHTSQNLEHTPVMVREIAYYAAPVLSRPNCDYFDGTFGRGGHFRYLWQNYGWHIKRVVAFDQDGDAIECAHRNFADLVADQKLLVYHSNFSHFSANVYGYFDLMLLDLGVSSPQLDKPERGFSFYQDGPLDMRMNKNQVLTAADIVNQWTERELISLFQNYGEIRSPFRVVRAIVHDRKTQPFLTTRQLASLIERVEGWHHRGKHPATLYFQALRIEVNQELDHLKKGLPALVAGLKPKGRLMVLTFHSLEDRIVKWMFKEDFKNIGRPLLKKVVEASPEEVKENPRARSAKLRIFEKSDLETTP